MSVHERQVAGRKKWEVRWREGDRNRSRIFDVAKDARIFDREIRRLRQAGEFDVEMERRRVTVAQLIDEWWERSTPGLTQKTIDTYALQIKKRVRPTFGERRVSQLTVKDVEDWISGMRRNGDGDATIIKACTVLQALLSIAQRDAIVTVNVVQQAKKPAQGRQRVPHLVKPESVEMMRAYLQAHGRERDVMLIELLAYAGLRPESEAITLRWAQVRERSILVRDTKRKRERSVVLLEPLAEALARWRMRSGRPDSDALVIPTQVIGPWTEYDWRNWRRRVFKPAAAAAGLPSDVRPRDLRGSLVSLLIHEGRSIVEVARQIGHSPAICLRDYAQIFDEADPDERRPATEIIAEARENAAQKFASGSHGADLEEEDVA